MAATKVALFLIASDKMKAFSYTFLEELQCATLLVIFELDPILYSKIQLLAEAWFFFIVCFVYKYSYLFIQLLL